MGHFVGSQTNPIDKKCRVSIPSVFRAALGEPVKSIYVFPSVDIKRDCYVIWSEAEMGRLIDKMRRGFKSLDSQEKKIAMLAIRTSRQITVDDNGRMQLPTEIMTRLGISDAVTFAGEGLYCLLFAPDQHQADMDRLEASRIEDGDETLMGLVSDSGEGE